MLPALLGAEETRMNRLKAVGYIVGFIALVPFLFIGFAYVFGAEAIERRQLRKKFERSALPAPRA